VAAQSAARTELLPRLTADRRPLPDVFVGAARRPALVDDAVGLRKSPRRSDTTGGNIPVRADVAVAVKVEVYSDIACPWCYIGKHRFEQALGEFAGAADVDVVYRPYQLDPDAPTEARSHREYLDERYGPRSAQLDAGVARIGATVGIDFDFDAALHVNTFDGHRLLGLALREYGARTQADLEEKLLAARFAHGGNVGDHEQLTRLAAEVGMDRQRVRDYLASDEGRQETAAELAHARARGISSVPTFVFEGKWAVAGAREVETFRDVLNQVAANT
jgi:predicted DsbA family dithiol-disulfide isomerase